MKKHKTLTLLLALAALTGIAAWLHLTTRQEGAAGALQITANGETYTVALSDLDYEQVSGVRVNGKGESLPVEGAGISLESLLEDAGISSYSKVTVISGDSYRAALTAEEVQEEGRAYLLRQEEELRLVVFGDQDSKRSVSNVVQLVAE